MAGGFTGRPEAAKEAGKKGGESMKRKAEGTTYYADIGRQGGDKVKVRYGAEYYQIIGRMGGKARHGNKKDGRDTSDASGDIPGGEG